MQRKGARPDTNELTLDLVEMRGAGQLNGHCTTKVPNLL